MFFGVHPSRSLFLSGAKIALAASLRVFLLIPIESRRFFSGGHCNLYEDTAPPPPLFVPAIKPIPLLVCLAQTDRNLRPVCNFALHAGHALSSRLLESDDKDFDKIGETVKFRC